jgi:hypothetical protein
MQSRPSPLAIRASACFEQRGSKTFGYPRQAPLLTAGDGLAGPISFSRIRSAHWITFAALVAASAEHGAKPIPEYDRSKEKRWGRLKLKRDM